MADNIGDVLVRLCSQLQQGDDAGLDGELEAELAGLLSPDALCTAFTTHSSTTGGKLGIDYRGITKTFDHLSRKGRAWHVVTRILLQNFTSLPESLRRKPESTALMRAIPVILHCPVLLRPDEERCRELVLVLALALLQARNNSQIQSQAIEQWFANDHVLLKKAIEVFNGGLADFMTTKACKGFDSLDTYINVLRILNEINEKNGCPLPRRLFCIKGLEVSQNLADHFSNYVISKTRAGKTASMYKISNWLQVPFLLNVRTKWKFLSLERSFIREGKTKQADMENSIRQRVNSTILASWFPQARRPLIPTHLRFHVDRKKIIQSAIENVDKYWQDSEAPNPIWLNPLEVNFLGETAVDLGGPSKDFFQHLFAALMDTNIFQKLDEKIVSSDMWFNPANRDYCTLEKIGLLFALLIFNGTIVSVPLPVLLYEKILSDSEPVPADLEKIDRGFVKQLYELRGMAADVLEALELDFRGLQRGGENICVTKENLELYINETMNNRLAISQLRVFAKGFNRLASMTPVMRDIFEAEDLRDVILGEELDWKAFRQSARYEFPYCEDHSVIKMFWKVFHELDEGDKRKFLKFLTGADHVPVGGFVPFPVRRLDNKAKPYRHATEPDKYPEPADLMPEVMTCRGYLSMDLPEYQTEDDLRFRLIMAMQTSGFYREAPRY